MTRTTHDIRRPLACLCVAAVVVGCFDPRDLGGEASSGESGTTDDPTTTGPTSSGSETSAGPTSASTDPPPSSTSGSDSSSGSESGGESSGGDIRCSTPEELSVFPTVGQTQGVAVRGINAFLTETNNGLHVLDISDPASVAQLGVVDLPNPRAVTAASGFAFVADPTGLIAVDVGVPANPIAVTTHPLPASVSDVVVVDAVAYAVTENNADPCDACGLHLVDVADPAAGMVSRGDVAIGDRAMGVAVDGGVALVAAGSDGLVTVDVQVPVPTVLDTAPVSGFASSVAVAGTHAYVAAGSAGMVVFDVSDPADVMEVGSIAGSFVLGVAVEGNWAWLADSDQGLRVIDVSDPAAPVQIAAVDTFGAGSDVAVDGGIAYVTSWDGDLRVFASPVCR